MKTQLRKLRLLERIFDMDMFFSVNVSSDTIILNGWVSNKTNSTLSQYFDFEYDQDLVWFKAKRNNIVIYLSIK